MNKIFKKMKENGGFTLVELIVVIAILAILAGVAVPAYTGYINEANNAADITACDAIKTAVFAAYAEEGDAAPAYIKVVDGNVYVGANASDSAVLANDTTNTSKTYLTNFASYYGAEMSSIDIKNASAEWTASSGEWTITK